MADVNGFTEAVLAQRRSMLDVRLPGSVAVLSATPQPTFGAIPDLETADCALRDRRGLAGAL